MTRVRGVTASGLRCALPRGGVPPSYLYLIILFIASYLISPYLIFSLSHLISSQLISYGALSHEGSAAKWRKYASGHSCHASWWRTCTHAHMHTCMVVPPCANVRKPSRALHERKSLGCWVRGRIHTSHASVSCCEMMGPVATCRRPCKYLGGWKARVDDEGEGEGGR